MLMTQGKEERGRSHSAPAMTPDVAARRLLRAKFGKHHAFYQTINYPVRSFH
jgi:hypothetical protein